MSHKAMVADATRVPAFDRWMELVDMFVQKRTGMSYLDLSDCCYGDWYDEGMTPSRAASMAIKNAKDE